MYGDYPITFTLSRRFRPLLQQVHIMIEGQNVASFDSTGYICTPIYYKKISDTNIVVYGYYGIWESIEILNLYIPTYASYILDVTLCNDHLDALPDGCLECSYAYQYMLICSSLPESPDPNMFYCIPE